jgi:hypothetical protein
MRRAKKLNTNSEYLNYLDELRNKLNENSLYALLARSEKI